MITTLDAPFSLRKGNDEISTARDAHALYARFGFAPLARPERFMELHRPDVYDTRV